MFRNLCFAVIFAFDAAGPVEARNYAFPEKNPTATVVIPDSWDVDEIEFGYTASSPDEDIIFTVETASASRLDRMMEQNMQWLKEQDIVPKGKPKEQEININGIAATLFTYEATDPDGDTVFEFVIFPAGQGRVVLMSLWGSDEARAENKKEIDIIINSIKPIN